MCHNSEMKHFSNARVAEILNEMAALSEMEGEAFKPRAYERAALSVEARTEPLAETLTTKGEKGLEEIPGIGKGIAAHLAELFATGDFAEHQRLRTKIPVNINELVAVEGIGPKTVKALWEKLKIKDLDALEKAARAGKLRDLPGFGARSEEKILKGIAFRRSAAGRLIIAAALPVARLLQQKIAAFPEVEKVEAAGSLRRMKETVGDLDFLVVSRTPTKTFKKIIAFPEVNAVLAAGDTKLSVRLELGIDMDIRAIPAASWGAALNYFTGSKTHNIALRARALKQGWSLNEYTLFPTEEALYKKLGLTYIEPELREMTGEIEMGEKGTLPSPIAYDALKGDLQSHSTWTDGARSIEEMAKAAHAAGLAYIGITDHTKGLAMTGGMNEQEFVEQAKEIDILNKKSKIKILKSAEVNIKKDGALDLADDALAKLDYAGASVHSHFDLSVKEQTRRLIRVCEHPLIDIIFHPTARILNKRPSITADWGEVFAAAKETGTVMEIDAAVERLDLHDELIKQAIGAGVLLSIGSDAHSPDGFAALRFGIAQARRGWAEAKHIINTRRVEEMLRLLKRNKKSTP